LPKDTEGKCHVKEGLGFAMCKIVIDLNDRPRKAKAFTGRPVVVSMEAYVFEDLAIKGAGVVRLWHGLRYSIIISGCHFEAKCPFRLILQRWWYLIVGGEALIET
jgi:hypothetical protein